MEHSGKTTLASNYKRIKRKTDVLCNILIIAPIIFYIQQNQWLQIPLP